MHLARDIAQEIYDSGMKPGDRYRSEAEALALHGVSRGALREALRFLQIQGVIKIKSGPGGGTYVGKPNWEELASTLALVLQFSGATIESLMIARSALEPGLVALAARHATADDCDLMARAIEDMGVAIGDYPAYYRAYSRFWNAVADATRNPLLEMLAPALRRLTRSGGMVPDEPYRVRALKHARSVFDAIRDRDAEGARRAMAELVEGYLHDMRALFSNEIVRTVSFADFDPELDPR
ncbi:FadR/GntR family transcriptional regulator [Sphingopyxis lindanitolerans]|uniref:FadR/GntR family transcriptional regulator n=1 Tax=Sphingopyxis lindanitolerans TaxID=2054227 RepID=UPI001304D2E3|nr:FCD domain-containing protein [Sphingopyxis lindanitolerans]